ncbi:MAG: hypothetical protein KGI72_05895 [Patescibacteria group bacterium]|nr:hypothetical protein [Patescibacteria group bacterium]
MIEEKGEKLEEFKITFKNGALENLGRLSARFNANDDLEKVVAKAVKLLTFVKDAKNGKVFWDDEKGERYFVEIDKL